MKMSYVDTAIGTALFIFFLAMVLMIAVDYFLNYPDLVESEYMGDQAVNVLEGILENVGSPDGWEYSGVLPTELGLVYIQRSRHIVITEPGSGNRTNEPVIVRIVMDRECVDVSHNDTLRLLDEDFSEIPYDMIDPKYCSGGFLNETYIKFKVNISETDTNRYKLYYYGDEDIIAPSYVFVYDTNSWITVSGDGWTESTNDWSRYGGSSGSVALNSNEKITGSYGVEIEGEMGSGSDLGLIYDPAASINEVGSNWYFDFWVYVNDTSNLEAINISITDATDTIYTGMDARYIESGRWYHFEKVLNSGSWNSWTTFDASSGIDSISVSMKNSTPASSKHLILDEMHFETTPIVATVYPESEEMVVSNKKMSALSNLTYEQLKSLIDGVYGFSLEIN